MLITGVIGKVEDSPTTQIWMKAFLGTENMTNQRLMKGAIHWTLTVVIIVYLITGFGITEYRTVESLTFGLLTKSLAHKIHINLEIPFIILLVLHICLPLIFRYPKLKKRGNKRWHLSLANRD